MERMKKFLAVLPFGIFSVLTIMLILWLTLFPKPLGEEAPKLFPGADKIVHAIMFGFLTCMLILDYQRKKNWREVGITVVVTCILCSTAIGVIIEFAQRSMEMGRGFEIADMIADAIGAFVCGILWLLFQKNWSNNY